MTGLDDIGGMIHEKALPAIRAGWAWCMGFAVLPDGTVIGPWSIYRVRKEPQEGLNPRHLFAWPAQKGAKEMIPLFVCADGNDENAALVLFARMKEVLASDRGQEVAAGISMNRALLVDCDGCRMVDG